MGAIKHGLYLPRLRTCDHCGRRFTIKAPAARYCSAECRRAHGRYGNPGAVVTRQSA